jgi:hypothetical protein
MGREARIVFLSLLTILLYGFIILLEKGFLVLPFPLFDSIVFIVGIRFLLWAKDRKTRVVLGLFLSAQLFAIASKPFVLEIFINGQDLEIFNSSIWPDVFKLVQLLLLIVFFGALIRPKKMQEWIFFSLLLALLIASQMPMIAFLTYLPFSVLVIYLYLRKAMLPIYYLFILKASFDLLEGVMMLFSTY